MAISKRFSYSPYEKTGNPVKEIISDKVLSEIIVETRIGEMAAVITTRSVQDMGLKVGDRVAALVKATNVSLRRRGF